MLRSAHARTPTHAHARLAAPWGVTPAPAITQGAAHPRCRVCAVRSRGQGAELANDCRVGELFMLRMREQV